MIDSHCHLLPGLDDGAATWEEALALAAAAYREGTRALVVTPHYLPGAFTPEPSRIRELAAEFRSRLAADSIGIDVYPGCEAYLVPELPQLARQSKVITWGDSGRYLLVELPLQELPPWADQVLFELRLAGLTPIIAHPERCAGVQRRPEWVAEAVNRGMLVQVNGPSLTGRYGGSARKTAGKLLAGGLVHLLGSDAHSHRRPAGLEEAARVVERRASREAAAAILTGNPLALLKGTALPEAAAARELPRRRWQWPWSSRKSQR
ncbi:Tyrosine-protein phosphatase YwqE [Neomoorella glycerini]|uniref:protein-tyrosine-phosphatase n=1 Tax=Neomoorella glycerini TaxID=55779 RepID=A0A6I5ZSF4_9FIRM|nr:Tyrosine-protein phosphatase YwqE [Moorella glycerini]